MTLALTLLFVVNLYRQLEPQRGTKSTKGTKSIKKGLALIPNSFCAFCVFCASLW